ncbi:hypothetical protein GEMRC1_011534 [Eukaryota sp. GEM-RC1]
MPTAPLIALKVTIPYCTLATETKLLSISAQVSNHIHASLAATSRIRLDEVLLYHQQYDQLPLIMDFLPNLKFFDVLNVPSASVITDVFPFISHYNFEDKVIINRWICTSEIPENISLLNVVLRYSGDSLEDNWISQNTKN